MTPKDIDILLWEAIGRKRNRKLIRYLYAKLMGAGNGKSNVGVDGRKNNRVKATV